MSVASQTGAVRSVIIGRAGTTAPVWMAMSLTPLLMDLQHVWPPLVSTCACVYSKNATTYNGYMYIHQSVHLPLKAHLPSLSLPTGLTSGLLV